MGCANCAIAQGGHPPVYLCVQVKDATSNRWHGVGTQCILVAIEEKSLDRKPQATIKIGAQTYKVNSTDLELKKFKAMEAGNAFEVNLGNERACRSGEAQPRLQRRNSEPLMRRSPDRSSKTMRASSLPLRSSPRKTSPDSPRSSPRSPDSLQSTSSIKDIMPDDDMTDSMGDDGLITKEISRAKRMNDIVTTDIRPKLDERALAQALGDLFTSASLEEQIDEIDLAIESTNLRQNGWKRSPRTRAQLEEKRQELQGFLDELRAGTD